MEGEKGRSSLSQILLLLFGFAVSTSTICALVYFYEYGISHGDFREETQQHAVQLSQNFFGGDILGTVRALGIANPLVKDVVEDPDSDVDDLMHGLEEIRKHYDAAIVYVMDQNGDVVASTTYDDGKSLLGNNYAFRPYFQEAIKGRDHVMIAVGVTTKKRGIYYSAPIRGCEHEEKKVFGAVVIKMGFANIDSFFESLGGPAAFVSSEGVVFASNREDWMYRRYPLTDGKQGLTQSMFQDAVYRYKERLYDSTSAKVPISSRSDPWTLVRLEPLAPQVHTRLFVVLILIMMALWAAIAMALHFAGKQKGLLKEEADTYQAIFNAASDAIFVHNKDDGAVIDVNDKALEIFGWTREELMASFPEILCRVPEPYTHANATKKIRQAVEQGPQTFEWKTCNKNGIVLSLEIHLRCARVAGVERVLATVRDISERKQHLEEEKAHAERLQALYNQLKGNQLQLVQAEKMAGLGQMAAGMAHEINNPIGFVTSNLKTMRNYSEIFQTLIDYVRMLVGAKGASRDQLLNDIKAVFEKEDIDYIFSDLTQLLDESDNGVARVKEIVANLRKFAHSDESKLQEVDINDCVKTTLGLFELELPEDITLTVSLGDLPLRMCNATAFNQALHEILKNAREACGESGRIAIETAADDQEITVGVSDSGPGIPETEREKVFDPFFTTKDVGQGTGMGLAIAHGNISGQVGSIEIVSRPGMETTILIRLPLEGMRNV